MIYRKAADYEVSEVSNEVYNLSTNTLHQYAQFLDTNCAYICFIFLFQK